MTFLQLEYFRAVAETGSISRVAERYNISPAALSRSISHLERELQTRLFDHEGRSIVLNGNGRIFLQCASEIIDSMTAVRRRLADTGRRRLVRIRLDVFLGDRGELPVACKLARPDLAIEVLGPREADVRHDIRVFATPSTMEGPGIEHICSERFVAALPPGHRLAARRSIRLSDLREEPFVTYRGPRYAQGLLALCEEAGFSPRVEMTLDAAAREGLYLAIREGVGCSIVPERVSRAGGRGGGLALVPFSDVRRVRHIYAASGTGKPLDEDCRFIAETVRAHLANPR